MFHPAPSLSPSAFSTLVRSAHPNVPRVVSPGRRHRRTQRAGLGPKATLPRSSCTISAPLERFPPKDHRWLVFGLRACQFRRTQPLTLAPSVSLADHQRPSYHPRVRIPGMLVNGLVSGALLRSLSMVTTRTPCVLPSAVPRRKYCLSLSPLGIHSGTPEEAATPDRVLHSLLKSQEKSSERFPINLVQHIYSVSSQLSLV
jgi:hypothetical protein